MPPASPPPRLIASELFWTTQHASGHPLAIPRVSLAIDLCRALGWLPGGFQESGCADERDLLRLHTPAYVAAVRRAERDGRLDDDDKARFNLGVNGNPIHPTVFRRPAAACAASLAAARLLLAGDGVVYAPAGGTHHALADRASGYCVFNDPALAILAFLDGGLERVFYLDLDAHWGDGVQIAFAGDPRVVTVSIHEAGRWPMAPGDALGTGPGAAGDHGAGRAWNLPVPPGFHDAELDFLMTETVLPLIDAWRPEAVVLQCGADALLDDPMTKLALSNRALWAAARAVAPTAPRLLALGGGGYNPFSVARCWAGVWATLTAAAIPDGLPVDARRLMGEVAWRHRLGRAPDRRWLETLADPPQHGSLREETRQSARVASRRPWPEP